MKKILFPFLPLLLCACSSTIDSNGDYHVDGYLDASTDNSIAQWRQRESIPAQALIAVYPDGHYEIVEENTRTRYIAPDMNPYVNDFVHCYINMRGVYKATPVTLQAPCDRDPERYRFGRSRRDYYDSGVYGGYYHGIGSNSGIGVSVGSGGGWRTGVGFGFGF